MRLMETRCIVVWEFEKKNTDVVIVVRYNQVIKVPNENQIVLICALSADSLDQDKIRKTYSLIAIKIRRNQGILADS